MGYSLGEAAKELGVSKPTVQRSKAADYLPPAARMAPMTLIQPSCIGHSLPKRVPGTIHKI
jgi:hypothetical protein